MDDGIQDAQKPTNTTHNHTTTLLHLRLEHNENKWRSRRLGSMSEFAPTPGSRPVTDAIEATPSRGMLRSVGMGDAAWDKPQIGIASSWNEITPCNLSLDRLAQAAKEG